MSRGAAAWALHHEKIIVKPESGRHIDNLDNVCDVGVNRVKVEYIGGWVVRGY